MQTTTHHTTRFEKRRAFTGRPALDLALVGALVGALIVLLPTLVACSPQSDRTVDQKTDQAESDLEQAGRQAGDDLEQAGQKIGEGLESAGREASEQLREAGEKVQPYVADAELTARVKTRLTAHPDINPFQIDVDTVDGVVTLNGEVPTEADRDAALEVARGTKGVVKVVDNLKIGVRGE